MLKERQWIITSATADDIGGTFRLSFEGAHHESSDIPVTASADDMESFIEALPTVGDVAVSKEPVDPIHPKNGMRWGVTFLSNRGDVQQLFVSTDGGNFYKTVASGPSISGLRPLCEQVRRSSVEGLSNRQS